MRTPRCEGDTCQKYNQKIIKNHYFFLLVNKNTPDLKAINHIFLNCLKSI